MQLLLPPNIVECIHSALRDAGKREIGGILMGEHVGIDAFRVKEITVQRRGGTFASFVRLVEYIVGPLNNFFRTTRHDYTRFNYLGEWHSHHSFELTPSSTDHNTMLQIANDPKVGANFLALLLVRVNSSRLEGSVSVYRPNARPFLGDVIQERIEPL